MGDKIALDLIKYTFWLVVGGAVLTISSWIFVGHKQSDPNTVGRSLASMETPEMADTGSVTHYTVDWNCAQQQGNNSVVLVPEQTKSVRWNIEVCSGGGVPVAIVNATNGFQGTLFKASNRSWSSDHLPIEEHDNKIIIDIEGNQRQATLFVKRIVQSIGQPIVRPIGRPIGQ